MQILRYWQLETPIEVSLYDTRRFGVEIGPPQYFIKKPLFSYEIAAFCTFIKRKSINWCFEKVF